MLHGSFQCVLKETSTWSEIPKLSLHENLPEKCLYLHLMTLESKRPRYLRLLKMCDPPQESQDKIAKNDICFVSF
jgi:hypothetical protein